MNLKHLSDNLLLAKIERLVQDERTLLTKILYHLYEIDRRRLFSKRKHPSLLAYAMVELKYSEDQACRRIAAMRLLKDLSSGKSSSGGSSSNSATKIEEKINSGELNLTNIGLAQTLFDHEQKAGRPMDVEEKLEVLKGFENKTTREALKVAQKISPEFKPKKRFDFDTVEDEGLRLKLLRVKGKYAHTNPDMSLTELMHLMCDHELEVIIPAAPRKRSKEPSSPAVSWKGSEKALPVAAREGLETASSPAAVRAGSETAFSPAALRMNSKAEIRWQVWRRDKAKCTNCHSTYAVQEEHIVPKAAGGEYSLENIKLLCRKCNQRSAIEFYGQRKMDSYLNSDLPILGGTLAT